MSNLRSATISRFGVAATESALWNGPPAGRAELRENRRRGRTGDDPFGRTGHSPRAEGRREPDRSSATSADLDASHL